MNIKKYITLDQALEVLDRQSCYWAAEYMKLIPAADVRPVVRGKWKLGVCQTCFFDWHEVAPLASVPNFCPNCGANMTE